MAPVEARRRIPFCLVLALLLNLALWTGSRHFYARWDGVPPVPSKRGAVMMTLGDAEFAYRNGAMALQNLGDGGGRVTALADYDYAALGAWFDLLDALDPAADHVPWIAAYYFGAIRAHPEKTAVIVRFLSRIGQRPVGDKWRFLADAAFLAQHRMKDLPLALDIAYTLSRMKLADGTDLPGFARQYPAFILKVEGNKDEARRLMEEQLMIEKNENEVNYIKDFLIHQLGVDAKEVEELAKRRTQTP